MQKLPGLQNLVFFILLMLPSCKMKNTKIAAEEIQAIHLKTGEIVSCGPDDKQFGFIEFDVSCPAAVKADFNIAVAMLHSFEYDEAEMLFAKIINREPNCAMAYWGVAMCNYHQLWTPPNEAELSKGSKAVDQGLSLSGESERESDYIKAIALFYRDWDKLDHHERSVNYEKSMEKLYLKYPDDKEAAIFYALALDAAADPADKAYTNQRKAAAILQAVYPNQPMHPGIVHYLIHTYDYPGLAEMALPAARKYASIAPASAHAQHMPSHIFTRLGLWDESIQSNLKSTASARCYAENAGIKGHWDEELHGLDYLVYAYLQKAQSDLAKEQLEYLHTIQDVFPADFKVAYAFAAIPARYFLENKMWEEAARLEMKPVNFPWEKFPWQKGIIHFSRLMGSAHTGHLDSARSELGKLNLLHDALVKEHDGYKANQLAIQIKTGTAWILFEEGKKQQALELMFAAANMEDATEKHPVTPGEVLPARELLGDMLLEADRYRESATAYQANLKIHPNRFNGLYGAGISAEKLGNRDQAEIYYAQLSGFCSTNSIRPELLHARSFLKGH
jgi:tetratricopeptide (TPR) repeat protein